MKTHTTRMLAQVHLLGYALLLATTITLAMVVMGDRAFADQPAVRVEKAKPKATRGEPSLKVRREAIERTMVSRAANSPQFDAPYYQLLKKNKDKWATEDKQIDGKLAALEKKFGKKPNIIYILADDIGWGELGCYLGGKLRGTPTPTLDKMAAQGMQFLQAYAEPSCTPTRLAILSGRHPVRTGCNTVLWPGGPEWLGLHSEEVTIAEVLSDAGYHTAMWGKWHVGDSEQMAPEAQGFDYAHYGLFNGAVWFWLDAEGHYKDRDIVAGSHPSYDFPGVEKYKEQFGIDITRGYFRGEKGKGRTVTKSLTSSKDMEDFEETSIDEITQFVKDKSKTDKPFFIYWATYCQQVASSPRKYRLQEGVDYVNNQAAQIAQHDEHLKRLLKTLKDQGIAENTLLVWWSDNGPMYAFFPNAGFSYLRGGKGTVLEGGVRVPAIAHWPGMIEPGQDPIDLVHVTDLFTTAARIAGALDNVPNDRVTDGVDQTALLLLGEGHSRRDYMFHYSGAELGAVRWGNLKMHIIPAHGGLPPMEVYNIMRDPREQHGKMYPYLYMVSPFQNLVAGHTQVKRKFPDRVLGPKAAEK